MTQKNKPSSVPAPAGNSAQKAQPVIGESIIPIAGRVATGGHEFKLWLATAILLDESVKPGSIVLTERTMQ